VGGMTTKGLRIVFQRKKNKKPLKAKKKGKKTRV